MRWTLRIKLGLGLTVILIAIMVPSLLVLTVSTREHMVEYSRNFAIHISDVAEAGLENAMISRDLTQITSVLQAIDHREGIEGVIVFDKRGEIKYSAVVSDVGRVLTIDDPTCRVCHDHPLTDRPQTVILPAKDGGRILRVARPILNQPRCQGCHQERVLGMLVTDFSLAEADRQVTGTLEELLLWSLLTMAGVLGAAIGFVHLMVARPLSHLLRVTQSISAGDLNRRVALATGDEIGDLATSFDQMVQRVAARTRDLETLNSMAVTVSQSLDLKGIMHRALEKVCQITEAEWGAIHLLDNPTAELVLVASYGLPTSAAQKLSRLKRGESFAGWVAESGESLMVENPATDPRAVVRIAELKSLAVVPLRARGQVVGTMGIGSATRIRFPPEQVALLQTIGHQVGVAIENARLFAETQRLSITDPLTSLYNRRALDERLHEELRRAQRYHHPLSVIMADLDHFKHYNDTHGHPQGDVILRQVAEVFRAQVRETDFVARYGGEEFVVLLPETTKNLGIEIVERIRAAVAAAPFPVTVHWLVTLPNPRRMGHLISGIAQCL
jgi:diguanylate cyclase (GGDEF)-like protein